MYHLGSYTFCISVLHVIFTYKCLVISAVQRRKRREYFLKSSFSLMTSHVDFPLQIAFCLLGARRLCRRVPLSESQNWLTCKVRCGLRREHVSSWTSRSTAWYETLQFATQYAHHYNMPINALLKTVALIFLRNFEHRTIADIRDFFLFLRMTNYHFLPSRKKPTNRNVWNSVIDWALYVFGSSRGRRGLKGYVPDKDIPTRMEFI